jgi:orotate phosphoribosyltransferase-like protein
MQPVYSNPAYFSELVKRMATLMRRHSKKFETIAFSGQSGSAMAYPMSFKLEKHLVCVRKKDGNHFGGKKEGVLEGRVDDASYCILDDFVESGATLKRIIAAMGRDPACVFLYNDHSYSKLELVTKFGEGFRNIPFYTIDNR